MLKSQKLAINVTSVVDFDHSIESFVTVMAHCFRNIGITQRTRVYCYYWIGSKGKGVKSNGFYATIAYRPIRQLINLESKSWQHHLLLFQHIDHHHQNNFNKELKPEGKVPADPLPSDTACR
jgi:hypothetical protein